YHSGAKCMMAFLGALLASAIVSGRSIVTGLSKTSVILSGVAISSLCASASQLILSIRPETVTDKAAFSIGGFASVPLSAVRFAVPVILCCLGVSVSASGCLDIMLLGDEVAAGLGLHIVFYRTLHMILASVLAGSAVSMCGLEGFVGLMVPNFIKLFFHGKARDGMLLCIFVGASLLLLCDTAARLVVFPYEIPCGLILSVLGTPFLIWILVKRRKRLVSYD
ncbi:MAG: iron ABC transporter permease, partial [Lachnospiraceae bacterium]|nr:iron ABC transporter permease [Lachnospiraceae bacterium]